MTLLSVAKSTISGKNSANQRGDGTLTTQSIVCTDICFEQWELLCSHDETYPADVYAVVCENIFVGYTCLYYCYDVNDPDPQPEPQPEPQPDPVPCDGCGTDAPSGLTVTIGGGQATICGYYPTKEVGAGYTGEISNLGFIMTVTSAGSSQGFGIVLPGACFQVNGYLNNQATASTRIVAAYNAAIWELKYMVKNNITPLDGIAIRSQFISLLSGNMAAAGGSFSPGPCLGSVPIIPANYCP